MPRYSTYIAKYKIFLFVLLCACMNISLWGHSYRVHSIDFSNVFDGLTGLDDVYKAVSSGIDSEAYSGRNFVTNFREKFNGLPPGNHRLLGHWGFEGAIPLESEPYKSMLAKYPKNDVVKLWRDFVDDLAKNTEMKTGLPYRQAKALTGVIYNAHLLGDYSTSYTLPLPPPSALIKDIGKNLHRLLGNNSAIAKNIIKDLSKISNKLPYSMQAEEALNILAKHDLGEKVFKSYSEQLSSRNIKYSATLAQTTKMRRTSLLLDSKLNGMPRIESSSTIFRKNLGAANPVQWARQLPGTASAEVFLSSEPWVRTRNDILKNYGNTAQVQQYLDNQEYLFRKSIKINNIDHSRSLNVKSNLAESLMDDFYKKDGWEPINGKRGRNGFDGLYVKRSQNGTIIDWIATDTKSGNAKLGMTSRGVQLSPEWVNGNLQDLLKIAEDKYSKAPTTANQKQISDLKQIMRLQGRRPRVFRMDICVLDGKTQYRLENIGVNGKTIGKPVFVDMQVSKPGDMQKLVYKNLEKQISVFDSKRAASIVKKIETGFRQGTIKSDSDLYRFIKKEIPDRRLAQAISQELGEVPPRGTLAGAIGKRVSKNPEVVISATVIAGFIIARDAMREGITSDTFLNAGNVATEIILAGVLLDYGINSVARYVSTRMAIYELKRAGTKITERAVQDIASKLAPTVGRTLGGGLQLLFAAYNMGDAIYKYNTGQMNQTDMLVNVGIVALTTAGSVFFTCTSGGAKVGAAIGSLFGPGGTAAGGAIGTGIGVAVGILGGVATGGYTWYVESKKQERLLAEAKELAVWETTNNKKNLEKTIRTLEEQAEADRNVAWRGLLQSN